MPKTLIVKTQGRSLINITSEVNTYLSEIEAENGILHIFLQHTSASLTIQENADPDVLADLVEYFDRLAPEDAPYRHTAEGPDDMPAHIKTSLTDTALTAPVDGGRLMLGTWQGIYVFEHRRAAHQRRVIMTFVREG